MFIKMYLKLLLLLLLFLLLFLLLLLLLLLLFSSVLNSLTIKHIGMLSRWYFNGPDSHIVDNYLINEL